ncbi:MULTISPECIES: GTP cyclohydrolase II [unclassified Shewanella]|uniref:GTP cyclohydrolase II n=1 Tax=unclassified Shewanella TaxID=196818 RepID=UPI0009708A0B|nr:MULTISPECIES: GTP cyclohydrolase II [unclassified Shewanella]MDO6619463.1 GTP cyclohydrolase II [Shewanella sp. 6_MG-2023]MDO6639417.1 GTP cyclohydrolase II [Shewanella sp. 5_MG-2023]MDO6678178.1 GTP cyclohydrolase II [Shewanella sp. 4_MG-2023]MDO6775917.1 GTP cyclohydrolase II [Shewanella sp. 3_MG-2023]PMG30299.1 GTP cyclohydrolase II [Shewanella sp. 10N.286.52.C2]
MSIKYIATSKLPTPWGVFAMHGFEDTETGKEHVALTFGELNANEPMLGRIHSECLTGDALFSLRCDCGFQLQTAMQNIAELGQGFILYLRQEGRGIGLLNKIRAYELQDQGANTVEANERLGFEADMRKYDMIEPMLAQIGVSKVKLMTNNPRKVKAMQAVGIEVSERVPLQVGKNRYNEAYLKTKSTELGHMMTEHHFIDDNK